MIKPNNMEQTVFNKAQLELLNMMSFVNSPQALSELKHIMSQYFASRAQDMMNEMWESGEMNDEKFESSATYTNALLIHE